MDDVLDEVTIRFQQARERLRHGLRAGHETARGLRRNSALAFQNLRRRTIQFTAAIQERKAWLRRSWRKLTSPRRVEPLVPVFSGPDFMESLFQRSLDPKLHALLQLRTAARLGCEATAEAKSEACLLHGWAPELIRAAHNGAGNLAFSEIENLLLRYADDITRTPIDVDLQVFRELRRHFTHDQIIEITAAICYENFRTRFRNALGIEKSSREEHAREDEQIPVGAD